MEDVVMKLDEMMLKDDENFISFMSNYKQLEKCMKN